MNKISEQTADKVSALIEEIKKEIPSFNLQEKNLEKLVEDTQENRDFKDYISGIGGAYVKFLTLLVKKLEPKNIVELGSREGLSTTGMYDTLPADSHFTTIDILHDQRVCPDAMFLDKRVSFLFGDVCDKDIFAQVPLNIDLLFSDTIHHNFQITDEFEIYQYLLADKALFAIDDIHANDKGDFFDRIPYSKWDLTELCHASGWGLFLYERKEKLTDEERRYKALEASSAIWMRKHYEELAKREKLEANLVINRAKTLVKKNKHLYKLGVKLINMKNAKKGADKYKSHQSM